MTDTGKRQYWLDLFTWKTWQEFLANGGEVSGFRDSRWGTLKRVRPGDRFLCYLTGVSRWVGVLEVTSEPYRDTSPIYEDDVFPSRVRVKVVYKLDVAAGVPVLLLRDKLTLFQNLTNPHGWTGHFRGSPTLFARVDGETIEEAVADAARNPVIREFDQRKLNRRTRTVDSGIGAVAVPERDSEQPAHPSQLLDGSVANDHVEIQSILLEMGSAMGMSLWLPAADRSRSVDGRTLGDVPGVISDLPPLGDLAMTKTIRNIDVLWLEKSSIMAAFEIENTTSVYSGLLRMADLIALQPNLNIPLYIVAPDERRDKVISEVNRPAFARLSQPMSEIVSFIPFGVLRRRFEAIREVLPHVKPTVLDEIAESCELGE